MNALWGISTLPTCLMRFLPAFCFSSSLRLRLMSPPVAAAIGGHFSEHVTFGGIKTCWHEP